MGSRTSRSHQANLQHSPENQTPKDFNRTSVRPVGSSHHHGYGEGLLRSFGLIHNLWRPVPKDLISSLSPAQYVPVNPYVCHWSTRAAFRDSDTNDGDAPIAEKASRRTGNTRQASRRTTKTISKFSGCGIWWNGSRKCRTPATF